MQLIESNADYLVLTLQPVDEKASEVVGKMGFAPEHNNHKSLNVKVAGTDDIRNILNAMEMPGHCFTAWTFENPTSSVFLKLTGEALHEGTSGGKGAE